MTQPFAPLLDRPSAEPDVPFALWQAAYLTGHPEIDHEHQELFKLVNTLHGGMQKDQDRLALKHLLEDLADHTIAHFQQEELLMQRWEYPRYERHKQSHEGLKTKVADLLQKFDGEETVLTVAVTQFLTDWLVHHIQGEDRQMTAFLQEAS